MDEADIWDLIKSVTKRVKMTDVNFRKQKSNGALAEKWVTPVYLEIVKPNAPALLERLYALSKKQ